MSSPIRWRFNILLIAIVGLISLAGYYAATAYSKSNELSDSIEQSLNMRRTVASLSNEAINPEAINQLRKIQPSLSPETRQLGLAAVIHAWDDKTHNNLEKRSAEFEVNEQRYKDYINPLISYYRNQVTFFASAGIVGLILGLLFAKFYLDLAVFRPLRRLYTQMVEFLEGRYTYQFSVPPPNEVGNLQNTFHSLAQRVLHNLEELKTLDQAKSDFLNIASHELRTPMTSIKGSLGLINTGVMGPISPEITDLLTIAENETDRLIRLTNDLLDMAKIEAGKLPLAQKWVFLEPLVIKTIRGLHGLAEKAKVQIVVDTIPQIEVFLDADRIQQVLTNLLSNALKFSPPYGQIRVRGSVTAENYIMVEVMDQGRGISPEDQSRLFQKFKQVTNAENPLVKGTGLGLAIAKALIEEHHGKIGVQSIQGKGSNFFFTLPKWRAVEVTFNEVDKELMSA